jgi:hypothetical protein
MKRERPRGAITMTGTSRRVAIGLVVWALGAGPASAQTFNSGSTGADGALNAPLGATTTLTLPPSGVFNFTTVNVPSSATVKFARNAANTPVTILASGNVTVAGVIDIRGAAGASAGLGATVVTSNGGTGGPGGFDGGAGATGFVSSTGGSGLGPGGGAGSTQTGGGGGAGYVVAGSAGKGAASGVGGAAYGTTSLLPLVGGSGGGGGGAPAPHTGAGGGGGGGALLVASSGAITFTGQILAQGGAGGSAAGSVTSPAGGGSGGSVRLVATSIAGTNGLVNVAGGNGGSLGSAFEGGFGSAGRVRVEAFGNTLAVGLGTSTAGALSSGAPTSIVLPNAPSLRISAVGGVAAPTAPAGTFTVADVVLPPTVTNPVTVDLAAANIPIGTTVTVTVKGLYDAASSAVSSPLAGTLASSTASASVTLPTSEPSIVGASANFLFAETGSGPTFVEGEPVDHVRVTATTAGMSAVTYVTRSGREVPLGTAR